MMHNLFIFRHVKSEWAIILMNLCVVLIVGYSVFLGASEETGNDVRIYCYNYRLTFIFYD